MKKIILYIKQYFNETDKKIFIAIFVFTTVIVYINYTFDLDTAIRKNNSFTLKLFCRYAVFLAAFAIPYFITYLVKPFIYSGKITFLLFIIIAPLVFALKITLDIPFFSSDNLNPLVIGWNKYWEQLSYWPFLLLIITVILFIFWKWGELSDHPC